MPEFPTTEPQIMTLVYQMINGFTLHQADFPHVPAILRIRLTNTYRSYMFTRKTLLIAYSNLRIATKTKNERLGELKNIMKRSLQKAGVDVANNPEKLKLIGWGPPKSDSQPQQIPGQLIDLAVIDKQNGTVTLIWKKPADGGTVYNYIIERRSLDTSRSDNWTLATISYGCRITLANQPKGIKLEYRAIASNLTGQSLPSNTVTITL